MKKAKVLKKKIKVKPVAKKVIKKVVAKTLVKKEKNKTKKVLVKKSKPQSKFIDSKKKQPITKLVSPVTMEELALAKEPTNEDLFKLVNKGRHRGFITDVELLGLMKRPECYLDLYEGFLDALERNGVSVVESNQSILVNKTENK